jgi:hypothetical protein
MTEPGVEGTPVLQLPAEEREQLEDMIAELLIKSIEQAKPESAS